MEIKVKRLSDEATLPTTAYNSEGIDLYAAKDYTIRGVTSIGMSTQRVYISMETVDTDIAVEIPNGYIGIIKEKSGLSKNHQLAIRAGVIDSDYRGNIKVLLENHSPVDFEIKKGDVIAQLLIIKVLKPNIIEVGELNATDRGNRGFGSSNKKNGGNKKRDKKSTKG